MLGRGMFDLFSTLIKIEDEEAPRGNADDKAQTTETIEDLQAKRRGQIQSLWDKHATTLAQLGLSIVPKTSGASTPAGPVEHAALILRNPSKLQTFLGNLTREDIAAGTMRNDIARIVQALETQLFATNWEDPDNEGLSLIQALKPIEERLERLNLSEEATSIAMHRTWLAAGAMRDYADIRSQGLLHDPEKREFGPATWHIDSTEEGYGNRWKKALAALDALYQRPKAKALGEMLRQHLLRCAAKAQESLVSVKESERKTSFLRTLETALNALHSKKIDG